MGNLRQLGLVVGSLAWVPLGILHNQGHSVAKGYSMKTCVGLFLFAFLLASCVSRGPSFEAGEDLLKAVTNCRLTDTGTATLTIAGQPTDAYRVIYTCNGVEVTRCIATVPAGQNGGNCNSGPNPIPNNGVRSCKVGPKNGNSAQAASRGSSCS